MEGVTSEHTAKVILIMVDTIDYYFTKRKENPILQFFIYIISPHQAHSKMVRVPDIHTRIGVKIAFTALGLTSRREREYVWVFLDTTKKLLWGVTRLHIGPRNKAFHSIQLSLRNNFQLKEKEHLFHRELAAAQ